MAVELAQAGDGVRRRRRQVVGRPASPQPQGDSEKHPFICAVPGCEHKYTAAAANATRTRHHVGATGGGVAKCLKSTAADKAAVIAPAPTVVPRSTAQLSAPTDIHSIAESAAGVSRVAAAAGPSGDAGGPELLLTPKRQKLLDAAHSDAVRRASLTGLFKHMLPAAETDRLHLCWAKAIAHACLPPNVLEDEYLRDAIFQTSLASAPYSAPRRNVVERKLLPRLDDELGAEVRIVMEKAQCRVLGFDGWDDARRRPLLNFMLFSEIGDEYIDNEMMEGKEKDAHALAKLGLKYIKWANARYPPTAKG